MGMRVVSAEDAARMVQSGDTLLIGGSGGGHAVPDALIAAIAARFQAEGAPRNLTTVHPVGLGDRKTRGIGHLAHDGLLKRVVCGTLVDSPPVERMALEDRVEAYTLPQGALSQLTREMASGRPGLVTHVGLNTFVDPRLGGGRQSPSATEDLVELVQLAGREWLFFKPFVPDVALLRGTTADEDGNVTMEQEAIFGEMISMAQATRRAGGTVIVQVKRLARRGTLNPKQVKIPGILVDLVVVEPAQTQTYVSDYNPAYAGELKIPLSAIDPLPFDPRKVIARRAALELYSGAVCNLGSGISTGIATVAAEEGCLDAITLTNEQGLIGGAPASGNEVGASRNYHAMIDQPYQFDFYDGGGLDLAFLSFAEVDADGSVNVSRFSDRIIGPGGFINISQNAKKVIFSGTFTSGGLDIVWPEGRTAIRREGRDRKFVAALQQLTYSGRYANSIGQEALYVTERAVFRRNPAGRLELSEVAPGIDLARDVLEQMAFRPAIAQDLRTMDAGLFRPGPIGLEQRLKLAQPPAHASRSRLSA
ncbi:acyl CoA:acetate/3-ketoacid CoA transferase [Aquabacter spiritensis]|uniref:Acetate CoA-transferase YdiF n=1 Tax=Aquabacter spiritensis TaxID=933073 RepID=A0A4R3LUS0_9HYPH|nr:CoA-transferase [Aquabacter spiritensis]TCT04302.1 propionate CoA-transferase [Aquabacter spiritensis]